ncbi:hypothetical protein ACJJTC_003884 [Scirpophaga incertulas]
MQTPDNNGYISINWPSKSIPHGGIFHTRVIEPSEEREKFLKVLLEESKLSIAQRRNSSIALRQYENKPEHRPNVQVPYKRPHTSRRRSLSAIRESGALEFNSFVPQKRGEDREKMKQELANIMAFGDSPNNISQPPPCIAKPAPQLPSTKEKWNDLVTQIRERAEWLAEMEYLGEAGPHREIIQDQIAERMRALDALSIDTACSSARTSDSGFSTRRSRETVKTNSQSNISITKSDASKPIKALKDKQGSVFNSRKKSTVKEENVAAYGKLSSLQYSPRRRV